MEHTNVVLELLASVLEVLGLYLVAREVWRGHKSEAAEKGWSFARRMMFHYTMRDWPGLLIEGRLDEGDSPEQAQKWLSAFKSLDPGALEEAAHQQWDSLMPQLSASIRRWEERTAPTMMHARTRDLWTGTGLLVLAVVLHLMISGHLAEHALSVSGIA